MNHDFRYEGNTCNLEAAIAALIACTTLLLTAVMCGQDLRTVSQGRLSISRKFCSFTAGALFLVRRQLKMFV